MYKMIVLCVNCGKILRRRRWQVKTYKYQYCNNKCQWEAHRKRHSVRLICANCKIPYLKPRHIYNSFKKINKRFFCSKDCFFEAIKGEKITFKCEVCGKIKTRLKSMCTSKYHFCSRKCSAKFNAQHRIPIYPNKRCQYIAYKLLHIKHKDFKGYNLMPLIELKELHLKLKKEVRNAKT